MISFKEFVKEKIDYFISHLKNKSVLMNYHGDLMHEINLSFYYLSDLYLEYADEAGIRNSQQFGNEDMPNINIGLPVG